MAIQQEFDWYAITELKYSMPSRMECGSKYSTQVGGTSENDPIWPVFHLTWTIFTEMLIAPIT